MRHRPGVTLAATLLLGAASFAHAQTTSQSPAPSTAASPGQASSSSPVAGAQTGEQASQAQSGQQGQSSQPIGQTGQSPSVQGAASQFPSQSGQQFSQSGQSPYGQGMGSQFQAQSGQQFGLSGQQQTQDRTGQRVVDRNFLRQHLRSSGFSDVRILDSAFLVEARTPDGRPVLMLIDPPGRASQLFGQSQADSSQQGQGSDQFSQRQRFGMQDRQYSQDRQRFGQDQQRFQRFGQRTMSEDQVRSMLEARGFSDIEDLEREGNAFTANAQWHGEDVDVRVDASSGRILEPRQLNLNQVRNLLQEEGWSGIRNIERQGNLYVAEARRNGRNFEVSIDGRTGSIIDQEQRQR